MNFIWYFNVIFPSKIKDFEKCLFWNNFIWKRNFSKSLTKEETFGILNMKNIKWGSEGKSTTRVVYTYINC